MIKNEKEFGLSESQYEFIESPETNTLYCGGLGSGKTFAGAVWAVMMTQQYPECCGYITANSYSQVTKATLPKFFEVLDIFGIKYTHYQVKKEVHVEGGAVVHYASMENPDDMRGIEVGWGWSDEIAFSKKVGFDVLKGRIRDRRGPCQWKGTTTPNGFNWLYDAFVRKPLKSSIVIFAKTLDNVANLSDSYYEELKDQYDDKLAEQELNGGFVNLTSGKVFYSFDRRIHLREIELGRYETIFVGLDFNVDPLCGVFCVKRGEEIYVFDELYLEDSNTFEAAKEILRKYPGWDIRVIPDETGNRRKTSAYKGHTDHEILKRANLNLIRFKNPAVKDRHNNLNRLFNKNRVFVSETCEYTIRDLEQLVHDNKDDELSHSSDTVGYVAWHLFPLKRPKRKASVRYL